MRSRVVVGGLVAGLMLVKRGGARVSRGGGGQRGRGIRRGGAAAARGAVFTVQRGHAPCR